MFEYVNQYYGVNACIGQRVKVDGQPGVIAKDMGSYIGVNFDSDKPGLIKPCHPTWKVEYLGMGKLRKMTRSQKRYQEYLDSVYNEAGHSFAYYLGIDGVKA